MKNCLPVKEGTESIFDYIKFLELLLEDLRKVSLEVSEKFKHQFNLTMGLNNEER